MGIYATPSDLRTELGVDTATLSDADANKLIADAEDQIDSWLGGWVVQTTGPSSGRKIVQADVDTWQWSKLNRATVKLAAALYRDPNVLRGPEWDSISGPDFSTSGFRGVAARVADAIAPLRASGLRRLTARATP